MYVVGEWIEGNVGNLSFWWLSAKGRYDMIIGKYLFTELGVSLKFSDHIIESNDGPFKGSTTPMVDLGPY